MLFVGLSGALKFLFLTIQTAANQTVPRKTCFVFTEPLGSKLPTASFKVWLSWPHQQGIAGRGMGTELKLFVIHFESARSGKSRLGLKV